MRPRAFSLLELLCVLAIVAILLALAVPAWRTPLAAAAIRAAASQTLAGLALARRTALASGQPVTLCLTADLSRCDLAGREWMVFPNQDGGLLNLREAGEAVLRRWPLPREVQVSGTRAYAWYLPQPRAAATLSLHFCHPAAPTKGRSVVVSQTGRPRIVIDTPTASTAPARCR
jgi:prepilin-type N-terminal cleavage/methylation domain-containing protein